MTRVLMTLGFMMNVTPRFIFLLFTGFAYVTNSTNTTRNLNLHKACAEGRLDDVLASTRYNTSVEINENDSYGKNL